MKKKNNAGSTIIAVVALLTVLAGFSIAALSFTGTVSYNVMASNTLRRCTEVGDGAIDYMFAYWRELIKENPNTILPTASFASLPLPTQSLFPAIPSFTASTGPNPATGAPYTIANYKVQATDPQGNVIAGTTVPPVGTGMQLGTSSVYYTASADVSLPAFAGRIITVHVRRVFQKQIESPWQYAIFYNDLLEVNPGATMTIAGWVHTNSYLYTAYSDLTFANKVDYVNDWGVSFAPGDEDHTGITPASPTFPSNLPPARGDAELPFGFDPTQVFLNTNANNSGYIELIQPPVTSVADPIASQRYYNQADIRIMIGAGNSVTMTDNAGNTINGSSTGTDHALYTAFTAAITTGQSFQDNREAATMNITTLNIATITSALTATSKGGTATLVGTGFNGVIYIANSTGSSTVKTGIRLKNGATMPQGGLTVVSENPVYIQGDYNTGQTSSLTTPANSANNGTGNNVVAGYTEQPCAVLGDAVNVLSNAWVDSNSTADLSSRNATPTTVNAAIVTGNVPTGTTSSGANSYSGGAENFTRLLENWSGQTFTYYGSMIELYKSQQSIGYWGNANVYNAPNRNWHFDPLFYTQPPPGTFTVVDYVKQRWYVQ